MNKVNKWIIALTVILPTLIEVIDTSVVNVSLDHIRGSLSAGLDEATWTITAYLVANAIVIPLTGWLSRVFGRKRYIMFSVALFTFSSFMCGSARSLNSLVFLYFEEDAPVVISMLWHGFPIIRYFLLFGVIAAGALLLLRLIRQQFLLALILRTKTLK